MTITRLTAIVEVSLAQLVKELANEPTEASPASLADSAFRPAQDMTRRPSGASRADPSTGVAPKADRASQRAANPAVSGGCERPFFPPLTCRMRVGMPACLANREPDPGDCSISVILERDMDMYDEWDF